jgi:hydroxymethylglutaryl-CoA lyase
MSEFVKIHDVSLRDGLQNIKKAVSLETKKKLLETLIATGLKSFEITSFVSPKAVPQLSDAERLVRDIPQAPDLFYSVLVPNLKGFERARNAGMHNIALVLAATESLNQANFNMSIKEGLRGSLDIIRQAKAENMHVRVYISAIFRCSFEGDTDQQTVLDLASAMLDAGADEIALADTIGGGGPAMAENLFNLAVEKFGADFLSVHLHDTRGLGSVLAWIALKAGIRHFDAAIGGLGGCPFAPGAAGNIATEDLLLLLQDGGYQTDTDVERIANAVSTAQELLDMPLGGRMLQWWKSTPEDKRYLTAAPDRAC